MAIISAWISLKDSIEEWLLTRHVPGLFFTERVGSRNFGETPIVKFFCFDDHRREVFFIFRIEMPA